MSTENLAYEMFDKLNEYLNEEITYELWKDGRETKLTDTLTFVQSFKGFGTDKKFIPFISEYSAVKSVKSSSTGEILYKNPYLKKGYGKNREDVEAHIRDLFGDNAANEYSLSKEIQREREKIIRSDIEFDTISKKNKLELIKEGISYINPALLEDFVKYANTFGDNAFGSFIIDKSINCMKKLEDNASFDEINDYINKSSRNSIIEIAIAGNVIKYSKQGPLFDEYYRTKYGFIKENNVVKSLK